ncbi:MAG: peptidase MA family metallohydrolase [Terriglobia bacterium]
MPTHRVTRSSRHQRGFAWFGPLCFCITLALAAPVRAFTKQTIYLKNGNKIIADSARMDAENVTYDRGGNEFTIPRNLVDHIGPTQAGDDDPGDSQPPEKQKRPVPLPALEVSSVPNATSPVIQNGEVNDAYIDHLNEAFDSSPTVENRHSLSEAYQQAAIFLLRQGHAEAAIEKYREALSRIAGDPTLETGLGYLLIKQNHPWQAIEVLLPAADQHSQSPDIFLLLGSAYYAMEDLNQAIVEWQKALALHDNAQLRQAVAQAERERQISGSYQMLHSQHFLLLFDEGTVSDLANQMIPALEDDFQALERDLDYFPQDTIHVILYRKQAFRDITRSPTWAGAVNDGKIRIPVSGLSTITPDLARVMKHELTHSFVHQETMDRCPAWFNEGLAQMEDGSTLTRVGKQLAAAMAAGQTPAFSSLQTSFLNLSEKQAVLAYAESLAALEYFRDTYGMAGVQRMLRLMRAHPDFSALLQSEFNTTYASLERSVTDYLERQYGGQ